MELDDPTTNFTQILSTFMTQFDADIYVYTHATSPFIKADTIIECIEKVKKGNFDSAFTASKIYDYFWMDGKSLNFDVANIPRSQDLKPIYRETSGLYVIEKNMFNKNKRRVGELPYIKETSFKEAIDINTYEDFRLAEIMLDEEI